MFSVLLSTIFLPSTLLCSSTLFCGVASLLLLLLAPHFTEGLYSGVLIMGFFVSWQFGTGFSWTSQYMNITGKLSSLFFVGKYTDRYLWRNLQDAMLLNRPLGQLIIITYTNVCGQNGLCRNPWQNSLNVPENYVQSIEIMISVNQGVRNRKEI